VHFARYAIDPQLQCIPAARKPGSTVPDPFTGGGTTGRTALQPGRRLTGTRPHPGFARLAAGLIAQAFADQEAAR
jgi:DNA modification methylase